MLRMLVVVLCSVVLRPTLGAAATFDCADIPCLRAAITASNANGAINVVRLAAGTYTVVDADPTSKAAFPAITGYVMLQGKGQGITVIERPQTAPRFRHFVVAAGGTFVPVHLSLVGGNAPLGEGAALRVEGTAWVDGVDFLENSAAFGGAVAVSGAQARVWIWRSQLTDNVAFFAGGGALVEDHAFLGVYHSTVAGNVAQGGGGLSNFFGPTGGTLHVATSAVVENLSVSSPGGGIANFGVLDVLSSTVSRNHIAGFEGGEGVKNWGTATLRNATVVANTADGVHDGAGGVANAPEGTLSVMNSIIADHVQDCAGMFRSYGGNVFETLNACTVDLHPTDRIGDPGLAAEVDEGVAGRVYYPLERWSRAVDAARDVLCPWTDQLGHLRVRHCDSGAVEYQRTRSGAVVSQHQ